MEWESLLFGAWKSFLKPLLLQFALKTDNKWDDAAIEGIDEILERVLGPEKDELEA